MSRRVVLIGVVLSGLAAAALGWPLPAEKPSAKPAPAPAVKAEPSPAERLQRRVDFPGVEDPKATLRDALDLLARDSGLTFDVNEGAFREAMGDADVLGRPIEDRPLPKMKNVSAERVLRRILARVPVPGGAAFMVRREGIEITTDAAQAAEVWPKDFEGPRLPLVSADFDNVPLAEALRELARQSEMNVVVDARAAEKVKAPVSARLVNAPLDTAVRTLADMAGLKPFPVDNLLYVTTADNADRLREQERRRRADADLPPREGNGPRQAAPAGPAGM
ncbi:MAG TPA: hypothetical protein VFW33_15980 [Gemmataceae bacterium]|nr:hypothetical protein [Gemmataceae bacterium]